MAKKKRQEIEQKEMTFAQQVEDFLKEMEEKQNVNGTSTIYSIGNVIYAETRFRPHQIEKEHCNLDWLLDSA